MNGKKRRRIRTLEIQEMINQASGRQLEILYKLKSFNKEAFLWMKMSKGIFYMTTKKNPLVGRAFYKQKYHEMWKQDFWKESKKLLMEYFRLENDGKLVCKKCGREVLRFNILHHDMYNALNYMTPLFCEIICSSCHYKEHKKK